MAPQLPAPGAKPLHWYEMATAPRTLSGGLFIIRRVTNRGAATDTAIGERGARVAYPAVLLCTLLRVARCASPSPQDIAGVSSRPYIAPSRSRVVARFPDRYPRAYVISPSALCVPAAVPAVVTSAGSAGRSISLLCLSPAGRPLDRGGLAGFSVSGRRAVQDDVICRHAASRARQQKSTRWPHPCTHRARKGTSAICIDRPESRKELDKVDSHCEVICLYCVVIINRFHPKPTHTVR